MLENKNGPACFSACEQRFKCKTILSSKLKLNVQKKNEIIIDEMLQIQTREVVKRLFRKN